MADESYKLIHLAHKQGMPVYAFCKSVCQQYGSLSAAGRALGVMPRMIARWLKIKRPKRTLVRLADAKGMDVIPYIAEMVLKYGSTTNAERALGLPRSSLQNALGVAGLPMHSRPRLSVAQCRLMTDLLKEGKLTQAEIADTVGCSTGTVYRHKYKAMKYQSARDLLKNEVRLALEKRDK